MDLTKVLHIFLFSTLLILPFVVHHCDGKGHRQAHTEYLQAKFNPNSRIDTSHFTPPAAPPAFGASLISISDDQKLQAVVLPGQDPAAMRIKDRIAELPGQPPVKFQQYGGYVTVDPVSGREFYYYFTEAQDPQKAKDLPLIVWLNGGPGCSSLGYGAMQELGPFRVGSDGKTLFNNEFAWNKVANVLFLESPAGVGFSYSKQRTDYTIGGDRKTAQDNYIFLINWLERFPEYKGRDFYLAGESYAGHYVPQLARTIAFHNFKAKKTIINLKGIMIGNAAINDETDSIGMYEYWASHALISQETLKEISNNCDFSPNGTLTDKCSTITNQTEKLYDEIDVYSIYAPMCLSVGKLTPTPKPFTIMNFDPCSDTYVTAYMNRPEVQVALHANVTKNIPYAWEPCSNLLENWTDSSASVLLLFTELIEHGVRVWVYSGDVDGRVPVTGTQYSLETMAVPITTPWGPWYLNGEVGGYVQYYQNNLTFATVRGAGHQVPSYRPDRSLELVSRFLTGSPLPPSKKVK
ncbi:OLC1v1001334C1 [Oldenlandia corymbosa var. corymbosa]|uniref:Carboxypeptidase n=1 Tax=Oldenlandia corymbosa var. corymbosa TaxID=529605 RepID=A0AAV1D5R7_OLDCO|nr:OLC1v1001334C1 [Oldenlandia corymbosa var. corymbosa]